MSLLGASASTVAALPFNQDMVGGQPILGKVMRPKAEGSVPRGAEARYVGTKEDAVNLKNPVPASPASVASGERLFHSNCSPCHGRYIEGKYIAGAVSKYVPGPNLQAEFYKTKSDGHFFQFIHFGGMAIMPAYGYKFSINEHWDIVNYIRHIQGVGK